MTDRDRLIELIGDMPNDVDNIVAEANYLIANGVILPLCKVGEEIWVIDRENGEVVDISCVMFLAKSKGCIIATAWINDYDLDETLAFHIDETQNNFDTDLKVYPDEDCFLTREEAEKALERSEK